MGHVILLSELERARPARLRGPLPEGEATISLFLGVRYERAPEPATPNLTSNLTPNLASGLSGAPIAAVAPLAETPVPRLPAPKSAVPMSSTPREPKPSSPAPRTPGGRRGR